MASLSRFTQKLDGEWVLVGTEKSNYRLKVTGMTDAIRDAIDILEQRAAADLNRKLIASKNTSDNFRYTSKTLPPSVADGIQARVLGERCLIDVDELYHDPPDDADPDERGPAVTIAEYRELIAEPTMRDLLGHAFGAVMSVSVAREADEEDATKNS